GGFNRRTADLVGLGDVGAAGQVGSAPLQRRKLNRPGLAAELDPDQVGQVAACARKDRLVAKSIQLARRADPVAQEHAVLVLDALAGRNDYAAALSRQLGNLLQKGRFVKCALRQKQDVGAAAVAAGRKAGGGGQPAGVAAHDLGHGNAAQVIHACVADDLLED